MKSLKAFLKTPYPYIFLFSYSGVWLIWDYIKIPAKSPAPAGIISYLPSISYNPSDNILRFLAAILVPPLACIAYWWFTKNIDKLIWIQSKFIKRSVGTIVVTLCVFLALAIGMIEGTTNPGNNPTDPYGTHTHYLVDTFHEGESLGPAISYEHKNLKPYTNFVVRHGIFEDAYRSVLAFKLFGRSIGAERTFTTLLYMLVVLCYFGLLLILFRGNLIKSALALAILGVLMMPGGSIPHLTDLVIGVQLHFRDITTVLFLAVAVLGLRFAIAKKTKGLIASSAAIGFIVTAGFANSVDTATYVTILSVMWGLMLWLINGGKVWGKIVLLPYAIGFALGLVVLGVALKGDFSGMISYLIATARYNDYLDGEVFTRPDSAISIVLLGLGAFLAGGFFWVARFFDSKKTKGLKDGLTELKVQARQSVLKYGVEIILAVAALVCMRSAIGRTDVAHFIYSVQWAYLLLAYLLINYLFSFKQYRSSFKFFSILLLLFISVFYAGQLKTAHLSQNTFPLHVPDSQLVRPDYLQTAAYLKQNLHGQDSFVTLTSEAVWYYLVNKPAPVQYPILWYADTSVQRISLANSIANNPHIKYIITNNNWTSDIDYVPNPVRFPEVYNVLYKDYVQKVGFGQQTVWQRN